MKKIKATISDVDFSTLTNAGSWVFATLVETDWFIETSVSDSFFDCLFIDLSLLSLG